jgi:hypothetical protein
MRGRGTLLNVCTRSNSNYKEANICNDLNCMHTVPELFGTFNASTATPNEVTLSNTFQTAIANFVKNPSQSPALNWPEYIPGNNTQTLARLAYNGNVDTGNFVQAVTSDSQVSIEISDLVLIYCNSEFIVSRILHALYGMRFWTFDR